MTHARSPEYLKGLLRELCKLPSETDWVEFKVNNDHADTMGENISALANAAALAGKANAYLVWGVTDDTHEVVGTTFKPSDSKVGNEQLENWLLRLLTPKIDFQFLDIDEGGRAAVLLEIACSFHQPVRFKGQEFIKVSTYTKPLREFPEKERALWRIFDRTPFERGIARERLSDDHVLDLLDAPTYFELLKLPLPDGKTNILAALADDALIVRCEAGGWNITNLGAILLAKRLADFGALGRKAMRVIVYKGTNKVETDKEQVWAKGYAAGFAGLIGFINGLVPSNEIVGQALRRTVPMYPELAVRELVANALIHQDLFVSGAGPMVEIFADRLEVTNPGEPLMDASRFLDTPPKSRNEALASLMRRMGICEERGSGIDKVVFETEFFQLPAPLFEVTGQSTRCVLFAHRRLSKMDPADRVRACYLHACLKYVSREFLTNTSIRQRFGIQEGNAATASRLIKEAVEAGAIIPVDENAAKRLMRYVPYWAKLTVQTAEGGGAAFDKRTPSRNQDG